MSITVKDLSVGYEKKPIVKKVSFSLEKGSVGVIVGPNGCGKSTLLKAIAKQISVDSGDVWLEKVNHKELKTKELAKKLSFLPQSPFAPEHMTVRDLVEFGRYPYQSLLRQWSKEDEAIVENSMICTEVIDLQHKKLSDLSGGQKQRSWMAMTLAQNTSILLLDEPTSMLDIGHQIEVLKIIKTLCSKGHTIVLVIHDLIMASRVADKIIAMKDGKILQVGCPKEVVTKSLVESLYNIDADILIHKKDKTPLVVANFNYE